MATRSARLVKATRLANGRDGKPGIIASPLPAVGKPVTFTINGLTFRGTPTRHDMVKGEQMAVFDKGLTPVED